MEVERRAGEGQQDEYYHTAQHRLKLNVSAFLLVLSNIFLRAGWFFVLFFG
jgi:hypothetical protein